MLIFYTLLYCFFGWLWTGSCLLTIYNNQNELIINSISNKTWLPVETAYTSIYNSGCNSHCLSSHNRLFMIFFLLGLFMVQICGEDILLVEKTFFFLNTFHLFEHSFVRKMFNYPHLLISQVKSSIPNLEIPLWNFQWIRNWWLNYV